MQMLCKSLSRHRILKAIVKYKTHPSIIFKSFSLRFSSFYFSQVDKKIVFLKTSKFHKVVQESDPHVRILKENVDYFADYTCFEIDEAITVRISVQIWVFSARNFPVVKSGKIRTNKCLYSDTFHAVNWFIKISSIFQIC